MKRKLMLLPAAAAAMLSVQGCASNYGVEGAALGAAVGAGVGAATDRDIGTSAAVGAAAGAVGGALIEKDGRCYRLDRYGREYPVSCR